MWNPVEPNVGRTRVAPSTAVRFFAAAVIVAALGGALMATAQPAAASDPNPGVFPPSSHPYGHSYAKWGKIWWEWALSFPADINPIVADGDADEELQPSGPVWYLAGTFGGSANRTIDVPADKALLVPLWNFFTWSPEDCWWLGASAAPDGCTSHEMAAAVDALMADPPAMSASLDGSPFEDLADYRARLANPFHYFIDGSGLAGPPDYPVGDRFPTRSDGFYLMLRPLAAGEHTLNFTVGGFLDVTYDLTVE